MNTQPTVVLLTGLLSPAWTFWPMRRHLRQAGFTVHIRSYGHLRQSADRSAADLGHFIDDLDAEHVHLVAHSFGGVVVLHLLEQSDAERIDRLSSLVFLGSPLVSSELTQHLLQSRAGRWWRWFLGSALDRGLAGEQPAFALTKPHALVAGLHKSWVARLLWADSVPGDGLVSVREAQPENQQAGASEIHTLPIHHAALLYNKDCMSLVSKYLQSHL